MKSRIVPVLAACISLAPLSAVAQVGCDKSYGILVTVNGVAGDTICSSSMWRFIDGVRDFNLSNSAYTITSQTAVTGRLNDVNVLMGYRAYSTTLAYNFVEIGESGSFTGTTRKESQRQFEDYVQESDIIGRIMKYQSKGSPTSPITGAGGLMPISIAADFQTNFIATPTMVAAPATVGGDIPHTTTGTPPETTREDASHPTVAGPATTGGSSGNFVGAGLGYGSYNITSTNERVSTLTLPLSYTIRNDIDPRRQLHFSLPVTLVELDGTKTVNASFGISYRFPLSDYWTIAPGARYGAVASTDRATVAAIYSASLMSTYVIPLAGFDVSIGNMLGYYATGKFQAGDYSYNPDISAIATRNGVMLSQPVRPMDQPMTIEYSLIDTRYLGSDQPYFDNFQEIGVTLGTNKSALDARSFLRGGLSYIQGPSTRGITINIGYWF